MKLCKLFLIIILCLIFILVGFCLDASDLATMDYAFQGQPFVDVTGKSSIDVTTMDYAFQGQPFVTRIDEEAPPPPAEINVIFFSPAL